MSKEVYDIIKLIGKKKYKEASEQINTLDVKLYKGDREAIFHSINVMLGKERDNSGESIFISLMTSSSIKYITNIEQKKLFKSLTNKIKSLPIPKCNHNNLIILSLLHGGGFTRAISLPELYCKDCGLNVTLPLKHKEGTPKKYGLEMTTYLQKKIIYMCKNDKKYIGVENISQNTKRVLKDATIYKGSLKGLNIIDVNKLEQLSGRDVWG